MVRDRANLSRYHNLQNLIENLSYISVNTDIEFHIHISSFGRVTALNVLFITIKKQFKENEKSKLITIS